MKKNFLIIGMFLSAIFISSGCNATVENRLAFNNLSASTLIVNFRGSAITVPASQQKIIKEIPQGTYSYATTYSLPSGATSSSTSGDVTGSVVINAGTRILVLYTSTLDSSGVYTLYATRSNSDDQTTPTQ